MSPPARTAFDLRFAFAFLLTVSAALLAQSPKEPPPSERSGVREYVPGLRIDWGNRRVEVDARVVLRKGPLELLACSPQTREHESILVVQPKALHIFQALGLIGLTPGAPVRFDKENDRWLPPGGESVKIDIRYRDKDGEHEVPAASWLLLAKEEKVPSEMTWVFAGSRTLEDGRFVADLDGTVICVVDFDSALIAIGALHTADNELLWLEANTEAIPHIHTASTIIIGPAKPTVGADAPKEKRVVEEKPKSGDNPTPDGSNPNQKDH